MEHEEKPTSGPVGPLPQSDVLNADDNNLVEVKAVFQPKVRPLRWFLCVSLHCFAPSVLGEQMSIASNASVHLPQGPKREKYRKSSDRSHQTYRLLRRKNLIVEAVRDFKIIEGLFPLVCLEYYHLIPKHFITQLKSRQKCQCAIFHQSTEDDQ